MKAWAYVDPRTLRAEDKPALAQEHSPTSRAAAGAIERVRPTLRAMVYRALADSPSGLTDEELCAATGIGPSTERPRRVELVEAGRVVDSGLTRLTKSRRKAVVWKAA